MAFSLITSSRCSGIGVGGAGVGMGVDGTGVGAGVGGAGVG